MTSNVFCLPLCRYADVVLFESLLFATEIRGAYSKEDAETQLSQFPTVFAVFSAVKGLPRIQKYLQSPRRIPGVSLPSIVVVFDVQQIYPCLAILFQFLCLRKQRGTQRRLTSFLVANVKHRFSGRNCSKL